MRTESRANVLDLYWKRSQTRAEGPCDVGMGVDSTWCCGWDTVAANEKLRTATHSHPGFAGATSHDDVCSVAIDSQQLNSAGIPPHPPSPRHAPASMSSAALTPAQTHALFDILIHHQLYAEIEGFKYPTAIDCYGFPFRKPDGSQTTSPLLQTMLNKFVLRLPGLNAIGLPFWQDKVRVLVAKLGEAELSESYDKGAIGARKALSTAISSLLEYVARGMLGGYPVRRGRDTQDEYDTTKPDDILRAWDDGMTELIYGDLLEELFERVRETDKLEEHSSLVKGAHEYILLK